jgi:hypothetical protein
MPVAATGVRHSSFPESRYETSLALVVDKRLYTDILTNTNVHLSVQKWLLSCLKSFPNLFVGGDSCFPFEICLIMPVSHLQRPASNALLLLILGVCDTLNPEYALEIYSNYFSSI